MNNEQKDILDLMAQIDSERPFAESDLPPELDTGFSSTAEAAAAFENTLALRDALRIQSSDQAIPDSWMDQIESFSDTQTSGQTPTSQITAGWRKLRDFWQETPYAWGGGLAAACALVLLIGQPSGQDGPQGIGSSITNSDSRVMSGALGGDFKSKTSSPTETEANSERIRDYRIEELSHQGITGQLSSDDCPPPQEESFSPDRDRKSVV